MNPNDPNEIYQRLKSKSLPEICSQIAQQQGTISLPLIARLVIEENQVQEKFKFEKEQIEFQHKLNMELMTKQLRWIKFSAILNAVAIIAAVLLGWFLAELKSSQNLSKNTQQTLQSQTESSTSASRSERIGNKVPLNPPGKVEKHK